MGDYFRPRETRHVTPALHTLCTDEGTPYFRVGVTTVSVPSNVTRPRDVPTEGHFRFAVKEYRVLSLRGGIGMRCRKDIGARP